MAEEKVTLSDGKEAARQQILDLVAEYCDKYHNQKKEFTEGQRIPYASRVYDNHEMVNLVDSALEFWLTPDVTPISLRRGLRTTWASNTVPL